MTGEGEGMLLILNDVEPQHEDEFNSWYDTEHMQERVLVPGFMAATRYRAVSGARQYCALYRTRDVGVFESDVYRQRLAEQSDWSRRILTKFVDPHRSVGRIDLRRGAGTGGFLSILKLPQREDGLLDLVWPDVIQTLAKARDIVAVSLFESVARLSGPVAQYRPTTRPIMKPNDRVILIEASQPSVLSIEHLEGLAGPSVRKADGLGTYSLSWHLARQDLA